MSQDERIFFVSGMEDTCCRGYTPSKGISGPNPSLEEPRLSPATSMSTIAISGLSSYKGSRDLGRHLGLETAAKTTNTLSAVQRYMNGIDHFLPRLSDLRGDGGLGLSGLELKKQREIAP